MAPKLTAKQKRFCDEYLCDLNATQAAIRAGYSEKTAEWIGPQLLTKTHVAAEISKLKANRLERTEIDQDYVLNRLVEIDQMDVSDILNDDGKLKPVKDWPKIWRQFVSGIEVSELFEGSGNEREMVGILKKVKWPDKLKNLELLGKHIRVGAFRDKVELTGKDGGPILTKKLDDMTDEELLAIATGSCAEVLQKKI